MQMTAVDTQLIESRKFQIEEIARAFRVNPQMLMSSDKTSTFASAESFFRNHVIHTLGPWVERFENVVDRDILAGEKDMFADLDERNLLRGDFKDQSDYYAKALGAGGTPAWMTQNDVRLEVGLEPIDDPDADRLFNGFQDDNDNAVEDKPDD
jgi:HK97 family phage portal protein